MLTYLFQAVFGVIPGPVRLAGERDARGTRLLDLVLDLNREKYLNYEVRAGLTNFFVRDLTIFTPNESSKDNFHFAFSVATCWQKPTILHDYAK